MTPSECSTSRSTGETETTGRELAKRLRAGDVVLLEGDLAAGKTTFVRGLTGGLGGEPDAVSSPSFVLLQSYDCAVRGISVLHHIDLYRLAENLADLREVGLEEVLSDATAVVAVEWPRDTIVVWVPADARSWRIAITIERDGSRTIRTTPPEET